MTSVEGTVLDYWATCEARDWDRFGALLTEDVVYDLPQTRERIHGRETYLRFNQDYPGDWHLRVRRVVGEGRQAASWVTCTFEGADLPVASFFDLNAAGLITRVTEFWPQSYDPPAGREHLVERY